MPLPPNQNPTAEFLLLYDDFAKFQSQCTFLCDAMVALALSGLVMDKWSANRLQMYAGQIKEGAEAVRVMQGLQGARTCNLSSCR